MEAVLDQVLKVLGAVDGQVLAVLVVVVEFGLRLLKTDKPVGIIRAISGILRKVAQVLVFVADLSDKVLPQRLK